MSSFSDDFDELDKLIWDTRSSVIAKLDAATDFDAVLADIYRKANLVETPETLGTTGSVDGGRPGERRGGVEGVCDHIDMINTVLEAASMHEVSSPVLGTFYLSTARRSLLRLHNGLGGRWLGKDDALRLIGNVEHNLREADTVLRTEHGQSLNEALHGRIGELMEVGSDISSHIRTLREKVVQLFDDAPDLAVFTPVSRS
jgi:hypothetical protein